MTIFTCKMCGGALEIKNNETVATCEYCGTQQTLPKLDDDRRANLYDRANHFRRNNEFDKAMGIYENILNEDNTDAEAYWSLVLCRYGIEYVKDPSSHKRVPTVNRTQFTSVFDDDNYKSALQYADSYQRSIYEEEAKTINEIQKGILAISQKEEPFDIFICYKESDNSKCRTHDSVLANDLYHQLTQEGFKVFFSRITLEDKLGSAFEPYIFAALNSAKVMVVLGTKPEFFNAVWVKNEWSRYLALIKQGQKKTLIPAYKDMDPYDLPEEFSHLQAQDMGKLGFMQDLIRGIKKIVQADAPKATVVKETVIAGESVNAAPLLKRAFMFLEDGDWDSANEYCEKVLDIDPESAMAYLGKMLAGMELHKPEDLEDEEERFDGYNNYQKAIRFADEKLKATLNGYVEAVNARIYSKAKNVMTNATTQAQFQEAAKLFRSISDYSDSAALAHTCFEKAEIARKDAIYNKAKSAMSNATTQAQFQEEAKLFRSISDYSDSAALAKICLEKAEIARLKGKCEQIQDAIFSWKKLKSRKHFFRIMLLLFILCASVLVYAIYNMSEYNIISKTFFMLEPIFRLCIAVLCTIVAHNMIIAFATIIIKKGPVGLLYPFIPIFGYYYLLYSVFCGIKRLFVPLTEDEATFVKGLHKKYGDIKLLKKEENDLKVKLALIDKGILDTPELKHLKKTIVTEKKRINGWQVTTVIVIIVLATIFAASYYFAPKIYIAIS